MREKAMGTPARVFFGFAVLVAACAFMANAVGFEVMESNAFFFVLVGALAGCVVGCTLETMRSGVMCLIGKGNCDPTQASGFWVSLGTYAWYTSLMGACMCAVAYAGKIKGAASFDVMLVPALYCLAYGMFFKMVGMSVACAVCGSCVPGGVCGPMNSSAAVSGSAKGSSKKRSEEQVGV